MAGELTTTPGKRVLRKAELLQQPLDADWSETRGEGQLQPACEPRVWVHCTFFLRCLHHIERRDRPRDLHDERIGYPVEHAKHKRESRALVGQLNLRISGSAPLGHVTDSAATVVQREHVSDLDAVGLAAVDADDRLWTGFTDLRHATVD